MAAAGGPSKEARALMSAGAHRSVASRRAAAATGRLAAIAFREERRCSDCGALGYVPCAHRPNGAGWPEAEGMATAREILRGEGCDGQRPALKEAIARSHGEAV